MPGGINYQALYDMSTSADPRMQKIAQQASKNLTPEEGQQWFDFQKQLHAGSRASIGIGGSDDVTPALAGVGLLTAPVKEAGSYLMGQAGSLVKSAGSSLGGIAKMGGTMYGAGKIADILHLPPELKSMLQLGIAMNQGNSKAPPAAPELSEEELIQQVRDRGRGLTTNTPPGDLKQGPRMADGSFNSTRRTPPPPDPPNLIRQGNVTNPGPGGTGSPSTPSGSVPNPLDSGEKWKGPMGNDANWSTLKKPTPAKSSSSTPVRAFSAGEEKGISELDKFLSFLGHETKGNGFIGSEADLSSRTPSNVQPSSPQQSLAVGDEADKRRVMFGGANGGSPYVSPKDRTPVGRRKPK